MEKLLTLFVVCFCLASCSGDDANELTFEEKNEQKQEELYQFLKANLVGTWKEYERETFHGNIQVEEKERTIYVFNANGTGTYKGINPYSFIYEIKKNANYIKDGGVNFEVPVIINIKDNRYSTINAYGVRQLGNDKISIDYCTTITGGYKIIDGYKIRYQKQ